jgi:eukaryotic-like serine/threonine-protein kinase
VLVVIAFAVGQGRDPGAEDEAVGPTSSQGSTPEDSGSAAPEDPTAEEIEEFASGYVSTAVADPEEGFALLTPAYQRASGGLDGYTGFWGSVRAVRDFEMVDADPGAGTATYDYTYRRAGAGTVTERVELTLEQQPGGGLLISGARTL